MEAVSGVFKTQSEAERAISAARATGIPDDKITLLIPGSADQVNKEVESVPLDATEQPGIGKVFGALAGGGVGLTGGSLLVALVPGLGPVSALGLLGAAILGAAGATVGAKIGDKLEQSTALGLPEDEIFIYEDALRKGRSVVMALAEDDRSASRLRELLKVEGAESVDAAREQWWIGLRSAEEGRYSESGGNFADDEKFYRLGFEAALHSRRRCMEFDQVSAAMDAALEDVQKQYPGAKVEEAFTRGYMRGREYYQQLCDEGAKAA
jgi:hypothetical protein